MDENHFRPLFHILSFFSEASNVPNTLYTATPVAFTTMTGPSRAAGVASLEAVVLAQLLAAQTDGNLQCYGPHRFISIDEQLFRYKKSGLIINWWSCFQSCGCLYVPTGRHVGGHTQHAAMCSLTAVRRWGCRWPE